MGDAGSVFLGGFCAPRANASGNLVSNSQQTPSGVFLRIVAILKKTPDTFFPLFSPRPLFSPSLFPLWPYLQTCSGRRPAWSPDPRVPGTGQRSTIGMRDRASIRPLISFG